MTSFSSKNLKGYKDGNSGVFKASFKPAGYYYARWSHRYTNVTEDELNVRLELAKELIAKDQQVNEKYLSLDQKQVKYGNYSRYEVYYAKELGVNLGKLGVTVQVSVEDTYNLVLAFYMHKVIPKSAYVAAHRKNSTKAYRPFSFTQANQRQKYRRAVRRADHKHGHSSDQRSSN